MVEVYDKAKWHFEGDFPEGLDPFQGYVHTGMFLGWLIDNGLVSDDFKNDLHAEIHEFTKRELTGAQLFQRCCDGTLLPEDLSDAGNRFAMDYFEFEHGQYLPDYAETLGADLPSIYHVADNWDNYEKIKQVVDRRYAEWKQTPA